MISDAVGPVELHVYDFDGTLFKSPFPPDWWHGLWWDRPESLLPPCVPEEPDDSWWNTAVVESARESFGMTGVKTVVMTGRLDSAHRERVEGLLNSVGLQFDDVYMKWDGDTKQFKAMMLERILNEYPTIERVSMWEDRAGHMSAFETAVEDAGAEWDPHLVDNVRNPVQCGPEDFMEQAFTEGALLVEAFDQTGISANYPYVIGRGPSFGWGTKFFGGAQQHGATGGFRNVKPNRGGALGGSRLKPNPAKPYSSEFSDHISDDRSDAWESSVARFLDGIERLKRDVSMAHSASEISELLASVNDGAWDLSEDIVFEHGKYNSLLSSGDIQSAKRMLTQGIDDWASKIIKKGQAIDSDEHSVDELTYDPQATYSLSGEKGHGKASWS